MIQNNLVNKILSILVVTLFSTIAWSQQTDAEKDFFRNTLTDAQKSDLADKARRKINTLEQYISVIGEKDKDSDSDSVKRENQIQREQAIDLAVKLFANENCIVEISSLHSEKISRPTIRVYLNNLMNLVYDKVNIDWYNVYYGTDFKKRPDGRYEAVATVYQRFTGTTKEGGGYTDITEKNIKIIIERIEIENGETYWDISLGDIKVIETKQS